MFLDFDDTLWLKSSIYTLCVPLWPKMNATVKLEDIEALTTDCNRTVSSKTSLIVVLSSITFRPQTEKLFLCVNFNLYFSLEVSLGKSEKMERQEFWSY